MIEILTLGIVVPAVHFAIDTQWEEVYKLDWDLLKIQHNLPWIIAKRPERRLRFHDCVVDFCEVVQDTAHDHNPWSPSSLLRCLHHLGGEEESDKGRGEIIDLYTSAVPHSQHVRFMNPSKTPTSLPTH